MDKFIRKPRFLSQGSYCIPKFHYAIFHYITALCPLACRTHIYNPMNYESVSFHHSWNSLPDVQITLRKTTPIESELVHLDTESQQQPSLRRSQTDHRKHKKTLMSHGSLTAAKLSKTNFQTQHILQMNNIIWF